MEHVPTCATTWPPAWVTPATPAPKQPTTAIAAPIPIPEPSAGPIWPSADDPDVIPADVPPCPTCGTLELWWDIRGGVHCQHCDSAPFQRGLRLAKRAARLRRLAGGIPTPPRTPHTRVGG